MLKEYFSFKMGGKINLILNILKFVYFVKDNIRKSK